MHWIKSPAWDLVWVLNALWLAPLVLLLASDHDDVRANPVDGLFFALVVPLWFGHRVSSAWLAYATPAYRPLLVVEKCLASGASVSAVALAHGFNTNMMRKWIVEHQAARALAWPAGTL